METTKGSTNTTLLVIILLIIVGLGVWYITDHRGRRGSDDSLNIKVDLPSGSDDGTPDQGPGDR